jgi:hypothetical protein
MSVDVINKIKNEIFVNILEFMNGNNMLSFNKQPKFKMFEVYQTSMVVGIFYLEFLAKSDFCIKGEMGTVNDAVSAYVKENFLEYIYKIDISKDKIRLTINYEKVNDYLDNLCLKVYKSLGFTEEKTFLNIFGKYGFDDVLNFRAPAVTRFLFSESISELRVKMEGINAVKNISKLKGFLLTNKQVFKQFQNEDNKFLVCNNGKYCVIKVNIGTGTISFSQHTQKVSTSSESTEIDYTTEVKNNKKPLGQDDKLLLELGINPDSQGTSEFRGDDQQV